MDFQFQNKSKFALLAINNIYSDLPASFQLSDGTWVMSSVPVPDLGVWKEWIGSIRLDRLVRANLVLLVEETSENPEILDEEHEFLKTDLSRLFYLLHLNSGVECAEGADLLCGSSEQGVLSIRQMSQMPSFFQSKGYRRAPITQTWLEDAIALRAGVVAMETDKTKFRRVIRGLNTLFKGLKETGQDRLHQFVRSLEALVLPDIGSTRKQFAHRCQTFARAGKDTCEILNEAFDMRSDTEHLHEWNRAVQDYPADEQEDVCWQRTRQIEQLACGTFSRLLCNAALREHFRTETEIAAFWKLPDDKRRLLWGKSLDISLEPLISKYDQWERAIL